jgi:hypothetical protein
MKMRFIKLFLPLFLISLSYQSSSLATEDSASDMATAVVRTSLLSRCSDLITIDNMLLAGKITAAIGVLGGAAKLAWNHYRFVYRMGENLHKTRQELEQLKQELASTRTLGQETQRSVAIVQQTTSDIRTSDIPGLRTLYEGNMRSLTLQIAQQAQVQTQATTELRLQNAQEFGAVKTALGRLEAGQSEILTRITAGFAARGVQGPLKFNPQRSYSVDTSAPAEKGVD